MPAKIPNYVTIQGEGDQVLMFVHGYGCDQNMWRFIVPYFRKDYKIVLVDLVGSGKSDQTAYDFDAYKSLSAHADDVLNVCAHYNLKDIIFIGHSVSAMIGLLAAIQQPHVFKHQIMVCPSPRYINDDQYNGGFTQEAIDELMESLDANYLGWSSAVAPVIMGNSERPELTEELENSFCRNNPEIAKHFAKVTFSGDNRSDLPKCKIPTLVLQCQQDFIAPMEVGLYVSEQLPESKYVVLDATGHCPHLSAPEEVEKAIQNYLKANKS